MMAAPKSSDRATELPVKRTPRGFAYALFRDRNGKECSIQKSSLATEDCIWLGEELGDRRGERMHLTRDQVADLLPLLQRFVETGEI
jgi:hypothetical protein